MEVITKPGNRMLLKKTKKKTGDVHSCVFSGLPIFLAYGCDPFLLSSHVFWHMMERSAFLA